MCVFNFISAFKLTCFCLYIKKKQKTIFQNKRNETKMKLRHKIFYGVENVLIKSLKLCL